MSGTDAGGVLRVAIAPYEEMKARTMAIARGERRVGADEPRVWFASLESFTRVLSERNRELLSLIADREPASLAELAALSGRAKPNLSRTLRTMERHGLVELRPGEGRTLRPRVCYRDIRLDLPVVGGPPGKAGRRAA
ncbi:HVO_A0114 family putative DNA-binding protein [Sediminicoccus rosea]|uniref:Helix-turn-helix domain-containing protein n=1 Tax=Sediminicoccus rosea TaxID=1225128 RepID=A0ABZ0PN75_9PROT|nr:helix-turn-helix domain-containing protein [Sediminicoccus rosea]WPB86921.1 helix-turn-helix domain-containing protein [Sediminicoccus rosea]